MFDPTIGRWLTQDPLAFAAGDADLYRYVGNNATNSVDPKGLFEIENPFAGIQRGIQRIEQGVQAVENTVQQVRGTVQSVQAAVTAGPIVTAIAIGNKVIEKIPEVPGIIVERFPQAWDNFEEMQEKKKTEPFLGVRNVRYWPTNEMVDQIMMLMPMDGGPAIGMVEEGGEAGGNILIRIWRWVRGSSSVSSEASVATQAVLKDGYYEINGFRFSQYYYEKLWATGRGCPGFRAQWVLEGSRGIGIADAARPGFFRYVFEGWELVYNPATKEVWHLCPVNK
jgi:hypothetical protein